VSTLIHVARRALCAQGVALLTLYTRDFTRPGLLLPSLAPNDGEENRGAALLAALKLLARRGEPWHFPVCWSVLTGALRLTVGEQHPGPCIKSRCANTHIERGTHMHLFLHARGVLSAAVRINIVGQYAVQQFLPHAVHWLPLRMFLGGCETSKI
jgi:urease accessory protein